MPYSSVQGADAPPPESSWTFPHTAVVEYVPGGTWNDPNYPPFFIQLKYEAGFGVSPIYTNLGATAEEMFQQLIDVIHAHPDFRVGGGRREIAAWQDITPTP